MHVQLSYRSRESEFEVSITRAISSTTTYKNGPKVHSDKQTQVDDTMEWENKNEYVIGNRLEIPVNGVKCMRCERRRD